MRRGVAVEVRTVAPGPDLIELIASGYPADAVLARQDDIAVARQPRPAA